MKSIHLVIKPSFDDNGVAVSAVCLLKLKSWSLLPSSTICTMPQRLANVTAQKHDALQATDAKGDLPVVLKDIPGAVWQWKAQRATEGDIILKFVALPRVVDEMTPIGPRIDLRSDQGGLMGVGITFIPTPEMGDGEQVRNIVEWNLEAAPAGTRAVSSIGEGPGPLEKLGPANTLAMTVYAVGQVKSHPPRATISSEYFRCYWFGNPSGRVLKLAALNLELFEHMSHFFGENPSPSNPYSVFLRNATPARGFGGTAGPRCYVLEYDSNFDKVSDREVHLLLAHEMVHNWPDMESGSEESPGEPTTWYLEGIADFYGCILPYRSGLILKQDFLDAINSKAMQYYTNPSLALTNKQAAETAWQDPNAQQLPYGRGFMYLTHVDDQIRKRSNGVRSLQDIVRALMERRAKGESYSLSEWLSLVSQEVGLSAREDFEAMAAGSLVVPPSDCLSGFSLLRQEQEILDYGFDAASLQTREVAGLKPGSRAAKAGLMNGDRIIENTFGWQVSENFGATMDLVITRGDSKETLGFSYWPRSWDKVASWQWTSV